MKEEQDDRMLWQQKRGELRIDDDAQQDWQAMSGMLDANMPVYNAGIGGRLAAGVSVRSIIALLAAVVVIAIIAYFMFVKHHKHKPHRTKANTTVNIDSNRVHTAKALNKYAKATNKPASDSLGVAHTTDLVAGNITANSLNGSGRAGKNTPTKNSSNAVNIPNKSAANTSDNHSGTSAGAEHDGISTVNSTNHITPVRGTRYSKDNSPVHPTNKKTTYSNNIKGRSNGSADHHTNNAPGANNLIKQGMTASHISGTRPGSRITGHTSGRHSGENVHTGNNRPGVGKTDKNSKISQNGQGTGRQTEPPAPNQAIANNSAHDTAFLQLLPPRLLMDTPAINLHPSLFSKTNTKPDRTIAAKKTTSSKPAGTSKFDIGILAGVIAAGSFTAKAQNHNFYGSLPVDMFFGVFTNYNFSDKWGLGLQLRGLNPQNLSGTYTHKNESKKDTNQVLIINDARRVYTADAALHLIYKPVTSLSLKIGPVFSYGLKEVKSNSTFQTGPLKKDSSYYVSVTNAINATTFSKSLNIGLSSGLSYQYGRFIFDAAYIKKFNGTAVRSTLGSYTATNDQFLLSIGFQISKTKK